MLHQLIHRQSQSKEGQPQILKRMKANSCNDENPHIPACTQNLCMHRFAYILQVLELILSHSVLRDMRPVFTFMQYFCQVVVYWLSKCFIKSCNWSADNLGSSVSQIQCCSWTLYMSNGGGHGGPQKYYKWHSYKLYVQVYYGLSSHYFQVQCIYTQLVLGMYKIVGVSLSEFYKGWMCFRRPEEKLQQLETLLQSWEGKKSCTKHELDSLIGQLQHVIKPGCQSQHAIS